MGESHSKPEAVPQKLRIVLIGKTGAGKTSTMNTFLGEPSVVKKNPLFSDETPCKTKTAKFGDWELVLADTPGLCHTSESKEEVLSKIIASSFQCDSDLGPHVLLYVHKWENGFTTHDKERVKVLRGIFGQESMHYFFLLITHVDGELSDRDKNKIMEFINKVGFKTQKYCVINNKGDKNQKTKQQEELVREISQMVENNKLGDYTKEQFKKAQEALKKEITKPKPLNQRGAADQHVTSVTQALLSTVLPGDVVPLVLLGNAWLAKTFDECLRK